MSLRYVNALAGIIGLMLGGCASGPQEHTGTSGHDAMAGVTGTVVDIDGEFGAAVQLMKTGDWHAAADRLEVVTDAKPRLSGPWTNLGIARNNIGDTSGAEAAFKKAIDVNTSQVVAYNELGIIYRRSGRLEQAAFIYNEGLKISPDTVDIHWNLGILYDRYLSDPVLALEHYERYRQLTQSGDSQLLAWISELRTRTSQVNVATGVKR